MMQGWPGRPHDLGAGGATLGPSRHARHDRDRELEALGGVHGHDAHRVVVGLGQHGLGHPAALGGLLADPCEVLPERAVGGVGPRPGLVDDEAHAPPQVAGPAVGLAQLEHAAVAHDPVGELAGRQPASLVVHGAQVGQAGDDGVARSAASGSGRLWSKLALVVAPEAVEVVVAAAEQRRAQGGDDRQLVGGVVDGPEREQQVADQAAGVDERGRLGPVGDAGRHEGVLERRQRGAGRHEDGDVAERGPAASRAWRPCGARSTSHPSATTRRTAAATSAASRRRTSAALGVVVVGVGAEHRDRRAGRCVGAHRHEGRRRRGCEGRPSWRLLDDQRRRRRR